MRNLQEIAEDVRAHLAETFRTIRFSSAGTTAQLLAEVDAVNESSLPAVVILIDRGQVVDHARKQQLKLKLVLVGRFAAGSDERAISAWASLQALMNLFPADVTEMNGVFYLPVQFCSTGGDPDCACFTFELEAHQAV